MEYTLNCLSYKLGKKADYKELKDGRPHWLCNSTAV